MLFVVQNTLKYLGEGNKSIYTALVGNQKGYLCQSTLHNLWKNQENSMKY